HNPDAANVLARSLDAQFDDRKVILVTNMLAGHEPADFYEVLRDRISSTFVVPVDFHRATPVDAMVAKLEQILPSVSGYPTPIGGLNAAVAQASEEEIILVTGTFYLVGELLRDITGEA